MNCEIKEQKMIKKNWLEFGMIVRDVQSDHWEYSELAGAFWFFVTIVLSLAERTLLVAQLVERWQRHMNICVQECERVYVCMCRCVRERTYFVFIIHLLSVFILPFLLRCYLTAAVALRYYTDRGKKENQQNAFCICLEFRVFSLFNSCVYCIYFRDEHRTKKNKK